MQPQSLQKFLRNSTDWGHHVVAIILLLQPPQYYYISSVSL